MLVAKYKFDKSIYENFMPVFNDGYEGYTYTDEIDSENENYVIRTIECDVLPTSITFGNSGSANDLSNSLLEVLQLDTSNCNRIKFDWTTKVTDINTQNWDTSNITNMAYMFYNCNNLTSLDVSNWDTGNVTTMQNMFNGCNSLTSLDVSNFDTSNVTTMGSMFYQCTNLTSLDASNWDTSKVTDMANMFRGCTSLTSLDVSNWNTSKVTDMGGIFMGCYSLTLLDLSNWSINNTGMQSVFYSCTKLHTLDLSNWTSISNSSYIFYNCPSLAYIKCNNIDLINSILDNTEDSNFPNRTGKSIGKIITTSSTNVDTTTLSSRNWSVDTSSGTKLAEYKFDKSVWNYFIPEFNEGYSGYFCNDRIEDEVNSPNVVTRELVGYGGLPTLMRFGRVYVEGESATDNRTDSLLKVLDMNTSELTNCDSMFRYNKNLTSITCKWDTSNVTNMQNMFNGCNKLTSLNLSNFDTSNVTNMSNMFNNCNNLIELVGTSNWDTSRVTNMEYMFHKCHKLKSLDLNNWDVSNVKFMFGLFYMCNKLSSLDLSNWNTRSANNMGSMFNRCDSMTFLDISNWDTTYANVLNLLTTALTDIGMLYCSQDTVNKVITSINGGNMTIWVKDTKASDYTATDYVTIKDYKEDNRTLYLNSPLLEGDEIINKEGKLYHYHKMGKVVLDGDENWEEFKINEYNVFSAYLNARHYNNGNGHLIRNGKIIADIIPALDIYTANETQEYIHLRSSRSSGMYISGSISNINPQNGAGINNWLRKNPVTVIYQLTKPYYELISDDPLKVKSYAEGKLNTSSIITPTSIQSIPYEEELTYLYTSTQYCIQFNSTANCTVDITLGGTKAESKSVSVGLNKIYITTPSTLVDNKLIINAKGNATISEVVVVNSNAEFDYFDGMKSSFEDCLVTDVDNENYGKYEVGVRIIGKNKFDGKWKRGYVSSTSGDINDSRTDSIRTNFIKIKYNTNYYIQGFNIEYASLISFYDKNKNYISRSSGVKRSNYIFKTNNQVQYIIISQYSSDGTDMPLDTALNLQIEEGDIATSYEPYKETNATIYLNSPLLKGDRIEVVDGKLCHYHKMGSVVLNGSEHWDYNGVSSNNTTLANFYSNVISKFVKIPNILSPILNNKLPFSDSLNKIEGIRLGVTTNISININIAKLSTTDVNGLKQWLQNNPITVVYELANPYYEDITPIQSSFVISTVSEGDMEIITDLPIKSNITYLTNITSAVLMEQQLDELDNGTESLTNIVEDEINE